MIREAWGRKYSAVGCERPAIWPFELIASGMLSVSPGKTPKIHDTAAVRPQYGMPSDEPITSPSLLMPVAIAGALLPVKPSNFRNCPPE